MVSFEFHQGINVKNLARHGSGAHKTFKTEFTKIGHQTLTYELLKLKPHQWVLFQVIKIHKMRCPSYQMNSKRKSHIGCCQMCI